MSISVRPYQPDDIRGVFDVFIQSLIDLGSRTGTQTITGGDDPEVMRSLWERRKPLWEHLAATAEACWVAVGENGQIVAYARAIRREDVRELTEFFVLPGFQSNGLGRQLLANVFPETGAAHRTIIATTDSRALARYLKTHVYPRSPIIYFGRKPEQVDYETDLQFEPFSAVSEILDALAAIDQDVLGYRRDVDHVWLANNRKGIAYKRNGQLVGYGYLGDRTGPFALMDERDYPAVLAHAEREAAINGQTFGVEVPLINTTAVDYMLKRGCELDNFLAIYMTDAPFGHIERYIFTSPPIFA